MHRYSNDTLHIHMTFRNGHADCAMHCVSQSSVPAVRKLKANTLLWATDGQLHVFQLAALCHAALRRCLVGTCLQQQQRAWRQ
jgi:hypothetical protein